MSGKNEWERERGRNVVKVCIHSHWNSLACVFYIPFWGFCSVFAREPRTSFLLGCCWGTPYKLNVIPIVSRVVVELIRTGKQTLDTFSSTWHTIWYYRVTGNCWRCAIIHRWFFSSTVRRRSSGWLVESFHSFFIILSKGPLQNRDVWWLFHEWWVTVDDMGKVGVIYETWELESRLLDKKRKISYTWFI